MATSCDGADGRSVDRLVTHVDDLDLLDASRGGKARRIAGLPAQQRFRDRRNPAHPTLRGVHFVEPNYAHGMFLAAPRHVRHRRAKEDLIRVASHRRIDYHGGGQTFREIAYPPVDLAQAFLAVDV